MATSRETGTGAAFELKGRMGTLSVLRLLDADAAVVLAGLDERIAEAPAMFGGMPVVIDAGGLDGWPADQDLDRLVQGLRERRLVPVALTGEGATGPAERLGLGILPETGDTGSHRPASAAAESSNDDSATASAARVVEQPVRSGQQVYGRGGDLVVTANISPGAEVMADGHIHIYGALNGRAMAGVRGDTNACIFCRRFNAELVAVAGHYQVSDYFRETDRGSEVRICVRDNALSIESWSGVG